MQQANEIKQCVFSFWISFRDNDSLIDPLLLN